jgi:hypothetical protein
MPIACCAYHLAKMSSSKTQKPTRTNQNGLQLKSKHLSYNFDINDNTIIHHHLPYLVPHAHVANFQQSPQTSNMNDMRNLFA